MLRFFILAAVCGLCTLAFADDRPPIYNFKIDEPATGSHIRQFALRSDLRVPLNRTYSELSPDEKAVVRSQYEAMASEDEPPYPLDGMFPIYQAIARANRFVRRIEGGKILLVAAVNSQGGVDQVQLIGKGVPGINDVAAQVLSVTKFKPATCGGKTCKMDFPLRLNFAR